MTERFYIFDEIVSKLNCRDYAITTLGLKPVDNKDHFNCPWRTNSDSGALQIGATTWTDHTRAQNDPDRSGNVIHLCARVRHSGDIQAAQEELGDMLGIDPHMLTKTETVGRAKDLERNGYEAVITYDYHDPETGEVAHQVTRYEHPQHGKEFVQHTPNSPTIKGVKTFLYRIKDWQSKSYVFLCEGEKDATNVIALGIPATTNPSGAGHWQERWSDMLRGKRVAILEDNDPAGRQRSAYIAYELRNYAIEVKVVRLPNLKPHGDVSDWIESQKPASKDRIRAMLIDFVKSVPSMLPEDIPNPAEDYEAICKAKELNRNEMRNYIAIKSDVESEAPKQVPIQINKLVDEVHDRFLGFPRRQGNMMFDHDRETSEIVFFDKVAKLFAWIQRKSKRCVRWSGKEGAVSREELFEALRDDAQTYSAISHVPDWPSREDVYYAHGHLPQPTEDHKAFWDLVYKFNANTPEDYALIAAYIMSPIYYRYGMARPMWVIDSDKTGSGKTTLATTTALLYGAPAIEIKQRDLIRDTQEITKRMISSTGRQARIVLLDNITGTFGGEEIAAMVTMPEITGRPVHGRDEESRPNNLTYTVTANNAAISDDIAIRSWMIQLNRPPQYKADWSSKLVEYVQTHQLQIFADIIDILANHKKFDGDPATRFPEVEISLLQACCQDYDEYCNVVKLIFSRTSSANVEDEYGKAVEDVIREQLAEARIHPDKHTVFLRSGVLAQWASEVLPVRGNAAVQMVRSLASQGHMARVDARITMWPPSGSFRRRGIVWKGADYGDNPRIEFAVDKRGREVIAINENNDKVDAEFLGL